MIVTSNFVIWNSIIDKPMLAANPNNLFERKALFPCVIIIHEIKTKVVNIKLLEIRNDEWKGFNKITLQKNNPKISPTIKFFIFSPF
jgi:hypothetical protein